jgi:hypothetical protein
MVRSRCRRFFGSSWVFLKELSQPALDLEAGSLATHVTRLMGDLRASTITASHLSPPMNSLIFVRADKTWRGYSIKHEVVQTEFFGEMPSNTNNRLVETIRQLESWY